MKCIDFDCIVTDTLHSFLRISDVLIKNLIQFLDEEDDNSSVNLDDRPLLKILLEFMEFKCKITSPYYIKRKEGADENGKIKIRSLNSNERIKIFEEMYNGQDMIDLFPIMADKLINMNFIFGEYFTIYKKIKDFNEEIVGEISVLKDSILNWFENYRNLGVMNSNKLTPYLHTLVHHTIELMEKNGSIDYYNCQGLEKLNHLLKIAYFSNTNLKKNVSLKSLFFKRSRVEFLVLNGANSSMDV